MYYTKEQPTSGSFVKVWSYGGYLFSRDFLYQDGILYIWDDDKEDYTVCTEFHTLNPSIKDVMYITKEAPKYTEMV